MPWKLSVASVGSVVEYFTLYEPPLTMPLAVNRASVLDSEVGKEYVTRLLPEASAKV